MHARSLVVAALTGLCLAATAGASIDITSSLRFGFVPQKAFPGQPASLSVVVRPSGVRCSASIRYADASLHRLPSVVARAGQGLVAVDDPGQGQARLGVRERRVREGRSRVAQLRRRRAALGAREGDRHQERLLAARALHVA